MNGCSRCQVKFNKEVCPTCKKKDRVSKIKRSVFFLKSSSEWYPYVDDTTTIDSLASTLVDKIKTSSGHTHTSHTNHHTPSDTNHSSHNSHSDHSSHSSYSDHSSHDYSSGSSYDSGGSSDSGSSGGGSD